MVEGGEPHWDDVRYFLSVARTGSLSAAARELGVRHTTVGRRLAALERSLNASLVVRLPDGLELTPLGRKLLPIGDDLERSMKALHAHARTGRNRVRLALPSGFGKLFAERIAAFHRAHPDISLDLMSGSRPVDLQHDEADLALRIGRISDESLIAQKLCMSGWSMYASDRYLERHPAPTDPRQLAGHEIIGFHPRLSGVPGAKWIEDHGAGATVVLRCAEMTEMLAAAQSGAGLVVMPCEMAGGAPGMRRLASGVLGSTPVSLVYRRERGQEESVRAVIRFVSAVIRSHAAVLSGKRLG